MLVRLRKSSTAEIRNSGGVWPARDTRTHRAGRGQLPAGKPGGSRLAARGDGNKNRDSYSWPAGYATASCYLRAGIGSASMEGEGMTNREEERHALVRVLVVDDQQLVRDGIASLLRVQDGITIVGTATNGQEALEQARALRPDVILMDVRMPVMNGVEATIQILREVPSCCILMLTTFDDEEYVREALRAGARGYLLKDLPAQDLARAVHAVSQGVYQLDAVVIERMIDAFGKPNTAQKSKTDEHMTPPDA